MNDHLNEIVELIIKNIPTDKEVFKFSKPVVLQAVRDFAHLSKPGKVRWAIANLESVWIKASLICDNEEENHVFNAANVDGLVDYITPYILTRHVHSHACNNPIPNTGYFGIFIQKTPCVCVRILDVIKKTNVTPVQVLNVLKPVLNKVCLTLNMNLLKNRFNLRNVQIAVENLQNCTSGSSDLFKNVCNSAMENITTLMRDGLIAENYKLATIALTQGRFVKTILEEGSGLHIHTDKLYNTLIQSDFDGYLKVCKNGTNNYWDLCGTAQSSMVKSSAYYARSKNSFLNRGEQHVEDPCFFIHGWDAYWIENGKVIRESALYEFVFEPVDGFFAMWPWYADKTVYIVAIRLSDDKKKYEIHTTNPLFSMTEMSFEYNCVFGIEGSGMGRPCYYNGFELRFGPNEAIPVLFNQFKV